MKDKKHTKESKRKISLLGNKSLLVEPMTEMGVVHKGEVLFSLEECKKLRGLRGVTMEDIKNKINEG